MKRFQFSTASIFVACLAILFLGCTSSSPDSVGDKSNDPSEKRMTVAVVPKSTGGEFWETVEAGARDAAESLGVDIKWEGTLTETEIAEQNKIIENMINLDVDGMAIAPLNNKATARSVAGAVDADIPVVVFDSGLDGHKHISFVATNNVAGGTLAGEHMQELLEGDSKKIVVLRYVQGTASTENRAKGFIDAMKAAGHNVVADPFSEDGSVAGAKKTASNTLEAYVKDGKLELDGIFACNLYSALGMLAALEDLRKADVEVSVKYIGFDSSPKLIEALQTGRVNALISQDPKKMGYLAVETVVNHLKGRPVEKTVDTGVELVTKERLENENSIRELVGLEPK